MIFLLFVSILFYLKTIMNIYICDVAMASSDVAEEKSE
jgi:hypothetical protein